MEIKRVVVTGLGCVTPVGNNVEEFWKGLMDGVSGTTCVVNLIANVTPGTQNLYWQDRPRVISNCDDLAFPKQTTAHIDIIWEVVSGQDVAGFVDGRLELYKSGKITVKGYNNGNANYNSFEVTYTFTINDDPIFLGIVDTDWNKIDNWNICRLPDENDIVTIKAPVELVTHEVVKGMKFADAGEMHIADSAGMTIGSYGLELVTDGLITIDNTPNGAGFLKVDPSASHKPSGKVTVHYTTAAFNEGYARYEQWQYMGAPGENMKILADEDKTLIYHWDEQNGWLKQNQGSSLVPFYGYAFTQSKDTVASFSIAATPIIPDTVQEIPLTLTPTGMGGSNVFVNSFLAPIDLSTFDDDDFEIETIITLLHKSKHHITGVRFDKKDNLYYIDANNIGVIDIITSNDTILYNVGKKQHNPQNIGVSPNGRYVSFCRYRGDNLCLYLYDVQKEEFKDYKLSIYHYAWLDDDHIAWSKGAGLKVLDVNTGKSQLIVKDHKSLIKKISKENIEMFDVFKGIDNTSLFVDLDLLRVLNGNIYFSA